jgi:hypothetical protein
MNNLEQLATSLIQKIPVPFQRMDSWVWLIVGLLFLSAATHLSAYFLQEQGNMEGMLLSLFVGAGLNVISMATMTILSGILIFNWEST